MSVCIARTGKAFPQNRNKTGIQVSRLVLNSIDVFTVLVLGHVREMGHFRVGMIVRPLFFFSIFIAVSIAVH
jgi:hypothetical protein